MLLNIKKTKPKSLYILLYINTIIIPKYVTATVFSFRRRGCDVITIRFLRLLRKNRMHEPEERNRIPRVDGRP